ncbi:MAG: hypothetical protein C4318_08525 [Acidimicrobiia bacterium]
MGYPLKTTRPNSQYLRVARWYGDIPQEALEIRIPVDDTERREALLAKGAPRGYRQPARRGGNCETGFPKCGPSRGSSAHSGSF